MLRMKWAVALWILFAAAGVAAAQQMAFRVDPAQSNVDFTLGDVLHTVHGTFHMKSSTVQFDPSTGAASGELMVDATSGDSGSKGRDKKMHKEVLESAKYPEIRFTVQSFQGKLIENGTADVQLTGIMILHGSDHPFRVSAPVKLTGESAAADVHFVVPYVKWGMKNPSTFILRVDDKVDIVVHAVGTITERAAQAR